MYIPGVNIFKEFLNNSFQNKEPWQIVTMTSTTVLTTVWLYNFVFQEESILERVKKQAFNGLKRIPFIKEKLDDKIDNVNKTFEDDTLRRTKGMQFILKLPKEGLSHEEILDMVKKYIYLGDYNWKEGRVSGAVYKSDPKLSQLMGDIYAIASYTNPLHPDVFPGVCKMEAEVIRMSCELFHGDKDSCGTMTTGGTESILMACKTFRDYAREAKGIKNPEIVLPVTAHPAFDKAAQYLRIRLRTVPINPHSHTVCIKKMKRYITRNTIMLVGSTPNFPYGTMDNIEAISELGMKYNIPVHVDACLGGFLLCFMPDVGYTVPPFDFQLPGVCSISADTHKYGYAPKGSSVILYRSKKFRHHQYTITTDWPGGIYGSPTVNGSRAGGVIATCWATLMFMGTDGYLQATQQIVDTAKYIEQELRKLDGIFVFGTPVTSVVAIGSNDFHIYKLSEALNLKGWNLNTLQFPSAVHICVTHVHTQDRIAEQFVEDVKTELALILKDPQAPVEGKLAIYGMSQSIPDRSVVGEFTKRFLDSMYYTRDNETETSNGPNQ